MLNDYCDNQHFLLIPELEYRTRGHTLVRPDGTVKDALRLLWGYWEAEDEFDDLDKEIQAKLAKGYPTDNILAADRLGIVYTPTELVQFMLESPRRLDCALLRPTYIGF